MGILVLVALAGFAASLVDGALGMGFGPTSSTILLGAGLTPAAVSTTVNVAKVATGVAGGAAHWRFGNVDRRLVVRLAAPGCVGAVVGATVLATVDGDQLRPYLAVLLLVVGLRIVIRFSGLAGQASAPSTSATSAPAPSTSAASAPATSTSAASAPAASTSAASAPAASTSAASAPAAAAPGDAPAARDTSVDGADGADGADAQADRDGDGSAARAADPDDKPGSYDHRYIGAAALAGGVTNGLIGTWGPVVTPVLLSRRGLEPRVAIGSANTAEVAVALVASGSLITSLGGAGVDAGKLAAMLIGGILAAPLAAWAVRHLAPRLLGIGAGGLMLLTNTRELAGWADLGPVRWLAYAAIVVASLAAVRRSRPEPESALGPRSPATEPVDLPGEEVSEAPRHR